MNNIITKVDEGAFDELGDTMEELFLQDNDIQYFPAFTKDQAKLKILSLASNSLSTFGESAFDLVSSPDFAQL